MTRVLLTGASGFIAAHVLESLLKRGHSVVATVRSQAKADYLANAHKSYGKDKLDFVLVEDIAKIDAFEKAVVSDPPFEAVLHTASPFHFNATDIKRDMLDPAINGTLGILQSIHRHAPSVKRVVVTSSFAAILDPNRKEDHTYSEKDWNPTTYEQAEADHGGKGYRGSKTLAEQAAWKFVKDNKPNFTLATMNPPLVMGPVVHYLNSLDAINTSNERFRDLANGSYREKLPCSTVTLWVDVRDLALAHVLAMEKQEAGGHRFFIVQGRFSNRQIAEIVGQHFPELREKLPTGDALAEGDFPKEGPELGFDNSLSKKVLGLEYHGLEPCVVDTTKSILEKMK